MSSTNENVFSQIYRGPSPTKQPSHDLEDGPVSTKQIIVSVVKQRLESDAKNENLQKAIERINRHTPPLNSMQCVLVTNKFVDYENQLSHEDWLRIERELERNHVQKIPPSDAQEKYKAMLEALGGEFLQDSWTWGMLMQLVFTTAVYAYQAMIGNRIDRTVASIDWTYRFLSENGVENWLRAAGGWGALRKLNMQEVKDAHEKMLQKPFDTTLTKQDCDSNNSDSDSDEDTNIHSDAATPSPGPGNMQAPTMKPNPCKPCGYATTPTQKPQQPQPILQPQQNIQPSAQPLGLYDVTPRPGAIYPQPISDNYHRNVPFNFNIPSSPDPLPTYDPQWMWEPSSPPASHVQKYFEPVSKPVSPNLLYGQFRFPISGSGQGVPPTARSFEQSFKPASRNFVYEQSRLPFSGSRQGVPPTASPQGAQSQFQSNAASPVPEYAPPPPLLRFSGVPLPNRLAALERSRSASPQRPTTAPNNFARSVSRPASCNTSAYEAGLASAAQTWNARQRSYNRQCSCPSIKSRGPAGPSSCSIDAPTKRAA